MVSVHLRFFSGIRCSNCSSTSCLTLHACELHPEHTSVPFRDFQPITIYEVYLYMYVCLSGIVYVIDPGFAKQKVYNPRIRSVSLKHTLCEPCLCCMSVYTELRVC